MCADCVPVLRVGTCARKRTFRRVTKVVLALLALLALLAVLALLALVEFGGFGTAECKLAISTTIAVRFVYFTSPNSTLFFSR